MAAWLHYERETGKPALWLALLLAIGAILVLAPSSAAAPTPQLPDKVTLAPLASGKLGPPSAPQAAMTGMYAPSPIGPLAVLVPALPYREGPWEGVVENNAFVLTNASSPANITGLWLAPREEMLGQRHISVHIWGSPGAESAGAGLMYNLNPDTRDGLLVFAIGDKVALLKREGSSLDVLKWSDPGTVEVNRYTLLEVVERGPKCEVKINGQIFLTLNFDAPARGSAGIGAFGIGKFAFINYVDTAAQGKAAAPPAPTPQVEAPKAPEPPPQVGDSGGEPDTPPIALPTDFAADKTGMAGVNFLYERTKQSAGRPRSGDEPTRPRGWKGYVYPSLDTIRVSYPPDWNVSPFVVPSGEGFSLARVRVTSPDGRNLVEGYAAIDFSEVDASENADQAIAEMSASLGQPRMLLDDSWTTRIKGLPPSYHVFRAVEVGEYILVVGVSTSNFGGSGFPTSVTDRRVIVGPRGQFSAMTPDVYLPILLSMHGWWPQ